VREPSATAAAGQKITPAGMGARSG
jgi:hypothetical protein